MSFEQMTQFAEAKPTNDLTFVRVMSSFPINWCYLAADMIPKRYKCTQKQLDFLNTAKPGQFMRFDDDLIFRTTELPEESVFIEKMDDGDALMDLARSQKDISF